MWLLPFFGPLSRICTRVYYRVRVSGGAGIPQTGPVLVVANHPNSLIDPMLVVSLSRRPIRFLAKAPLFKDRIIGWAIRASGSIPVHRQVDNPEGVRENVHMFRAVHDALGAGAAVGLFPEGISHSEPALTPIKTGAARMALGANAAHHVRFPIVPVGMVLSDKATFRSDAHVVVGEPVQWDDLDGRGDEDRDAVRTLTDRIDEGLRRVTLNLAAWEDRPLVECAEKIWDAERARSNDPAIRVGRTHTITSVLAAQRAAPNPDWESAIAGLNRHRRRLKAARLSPRDLRVDVAWTDTVSWTLKRLLGSLPLTLAGLAGKLVFAVPYYVTGQLPRLTRPDSDQMSTHKMLYGIASYLIWFVAAVTFAGVTLGWLGAFAVAAGMPLSGLAAIWTTEQWTRAERDIRLFFLLRRNRDLLNDLRTNQARLARQLEEMLETWQAEPPSAT